MKTIITLTCMLFCAFYLSAQTKYYSTTKIFNENGYSYQCDVDIAKGVTLYNTLIPQHFSLTIFISS